MGVDQLEDEDDAISITSTIEENPDSDNEWPVNRVLAEADVDGEKQYLIEWQGFSLAEATWEPRSNLKDALLADWERTKMEQKNGLVPKFRIKEWRDAYIGNFQAKLSRHNRRNRKRARLGYSETTWTLDLKGFLQDLEGLPDDDEASDKDEDYKGMSGSEAGSTSSSSSSSKKPNTQDGSALSPQPRKQKKPESRQPVSLTVPKRPSSHSKSDEKNSADSTPMKKTSGELASSRKNSNDQAASRRSSADFTSSRKNSLDQTSSRRNSVDQSASRKSSLDMATKFKAASKDARRTGQGSVGNSSFNNSQGDRTAPFPIVTHPVALLSKRTNPFQQVSTIATTNVFVGGHSRKDKPTLRDAALDPTKDPKLFNPHLIRTLELKRRDREGVIAPAQRPATLYSLDQSNPQVILRDSTASGQANDNSPVGDAMEIEGTVTTEFPAVISTQGPEESVQVTDAATSSRKINRKKRAVHWDDEPMELDPSDNASYITGDKTDKLPETQKPLPALRKMSLDDYRAAQLNREAVQKESQLGSDTSQSISLSFSDIPVDRDLAWISKFNAETRLVFTHVCTAQDFRSQIRIEGALVNKQLNEGTISSATHSATVEVLADRLRLGSRGVLSRGENYCVLLFPSGCDDWKPVNLVGSLVSTDRPLRYIIFEPPSSFEAGLFPLPFSDLLNQQDGNSSLYSRPFEQIFGPKYEQLLPSAMIDKASHFAGHWSSFLKLSHGVVLIHEDVVWAIRLFPNFSRLLHGHTANFKFWVFTRSLLPFPTFNSTETTNNHLGDLRLKKVFAPGIAILMTPSFFVSQPEQAYNFLKWFWQNYSKSSDLHRKGKLVVCANIEDWAYDLAMEKAALRKSCPPDITNEELRNMGIQEKALEARFKSWNLLRQLSTASVDEASNSLAFAPDSIDGNDEQSLVNWFGHWSIMNMDQFRKFTVLGSSPSSPKRLTRRIRSPAYKKHIISDPDEVEEASGRPSQPDASSTALPSAPRSHREDEATHLTTRLQDLRQSISRRSWCPISPGTLDFVAPEKVWVGGFGAPKTGDDNTVEITLQWLDKMLDKVKSWIPASAKDIPTRGWCQVESGSANTEREATPPALDMDAMDIGESDSDDGEEVLKTIFHPPRGHGRQRFSRCRNRLYNRAMGAEKITPGKPFDYLFRPTIEWYKEQYGEGRGFEHVRVTTWEEVFELYKIDNPKKVQR
ncbi:hypothetical protein PT974_10166 [Cladobotryum mycophilum]|uniref:Chromo domain-containing protein n=1 Tax=Cladobotryum mycophilum TaxID=491253 RepID=A0ABR0SA65_9HYPO